MEDRKGIKTSAPFPMIWGVSVHNECCVNKRTKKKMLKALVKASFTLASLLGNSFSRFMKNLSQFSLFCVDKHAVSLPPFKAQIISASSLVTIHYPSVLVLVFNFSELYLSSIPLHLCLPTTTCLLFYIYFSTSFFITIKISFFPSISLKKTPTQNKKQNKTI